MLPLASGVRAGWGLRLGWEELTPPHALFAGSCWLQGDGRDHWSGRAAGECPPSSPGAAGQVGDPALCCSVPVFLPSRAGKAPRDHPGTPVRREIW